MTTTAASTPEARNDAIKYEARAAAIGFIAMVGGAIIQWGLGAGIFALGLFLMFAVMANSLERVIMRLEGRLDNYMHPPATVSTTDLPLIGIHPMTADYLGCNNGMGYFAARSDGICYAADGP